ncbi:MAG TPA: pyridoxamine 5'-phosphate oxidase [Paenalcaligenes sp.]|nr:pyridoxamine 5'-phosphate oxidase [Paenalcaligenes sp.]
MSLSDYRNEYAKFPVGDSTLNPDPRQQFLAWLDQAMQEHAPEPTAMTLSTVNAQGQPTSRIVLLKGYESDAGLEFYTNYQSRKGQDLAHNPLACCQFFWPTMQRQVRFEGRVKKLSAEQSDRYFASRPLASRISAIASPQSQVVRDRDELEARSVALHQQLGDNPSRPDFWGGFILEPHYIEFWQGRTNRLHDRYAFKRTAEKGWAISRLAP